MSGDDRRIVVAVELGGETLAAVVDLGAVMMVRVNGAAIMQLTLGGEGGCEGCDLCLCGACSAARGKGAAPLHRVPTLRPPMTEATQQAAQAFACDSWPEAMRVEVGEPFRRLAMYLLANPDDSKPGEFMPANDGDDTGSIGLEGQYAREMTQKLLEARELALRAAGH